MIPLRLVIRVCPRHYLTLCIIWTIAGTLALLGSVTPVVMAQSPSFIQYQPVQLDFTPYRQNQLQQMQMMERAVEQRNAREANARVAAMERYRAEIDQIKKYYDAFPTYPETVVDGWHEVVVIDETNGVSYTGVRVNVLGNRVVEEENPDNRVYPAPIVRGKAFLRMNSAGQDFYIQVYFLDYIATKQ